MSGSTSDMPHHASVADADSAVGGSQTTIQIPKGIAESQHAFLTDLPDLLSTHAGQWVAYHRQRRVGIGQSKRELYAQCLGLGLREDEFVVCSIEPEIVSESDDPVEVG